MVGFINKFLLFYSDSNDKNHKHFDHLINFKFLHVHRLLVFELTAVGDGDEGDGVRGLHWLPLSHDLRHDLPTVVTQTIPEMVRKGLELVLVSTYRHDD